MISKLICPCLQYLHRSRNPLYNKLNGKIVNDDLDYYTLTNAVIPTRLEEHIFYEKFSELISTGHKAPVIRETEYGCIYKRYLSILPNNPVSNNEMEALLE
jgi:hypothetical protein